MLQAKLAAAARLGPAFDQTPPSVDELRTQLQAVVNQLATLEEHVQDMRVLVRQLSNRLNDEVQTGTPHHPTGFASAQNALGAASSVDRAEHPLLQISCFGAFALSRGKDVIPQRPGKGSSLLKYLASRPQQPILRDVLLDVLWPDTHPDIANNRLKVAMHHLRQTFGRIAGDGHPDDIIIFRDGCYLFNPRNKIWSDVEAFEHAWQVGRQLEVAGKLSQAIVYYQQAEALYQGDFLEQDVFEEWTLVRREELRDIYLTIVDKLSHYWFDTGDVTAAIEGWKKIIARDAWREDVYRQLMICFNRIGQRGRALQCYETCRHALRQQLGVEPEAETVALYNRLCDGPDRWPSSPAARDSRGVMENLNARLTAT